jgi:hypothetical protein
MNSDVVLFNKWRDGLGVLAIFPELPADLEG